MLTSFLEIQLNTLFSNLDNVPSLCTKLFQKKGTLFKGGHYSRGGHYLRKYGTSKTTKYGV